MKRVTLHLGIALLALATLGQRPQPNVPSDPGMYLATANGITTLLGYRYLSENTLGTKAKREKIIFMGAHAKTVVDSKPVFYFIPGKKVAEAGVSTDDMVLIRFEEKSKRRQFEAGAQGEWRESSGIAPTYQVQLVRSEERPGVFKVTPAVALGKGEYALYLRRDEVMQPHLYDFSVPEPPHR
jgi:hypothetical protein